MKKITAFILIIIMILTLPGVHSAYADEPAGGESMLSAVSAGEANRAEDYASAEAPGDGEDNNSTETPGLGDNDYQKEASDGDENMDLTGPDGNEDLTGQDDNKDPTGPDDNDDSNDPAESADNKDDTDTDETAPLPAEADEELLTEEDAGDPLMSDADIAEGWYRIASGINTSFVLDVADGSTAKKANIQLYKNNGTAAQIFYVKRDADGFYTFKNRKSGLYLNVAHASIEKGANIWQYKDDGTDAMRFKIDESTKDGFYTISSVLSGRPMDVSGGKAVKKANIQLWRANGTAAQMWQFVPVAEREAASLKSGYYTFTSAAYPAKVLDIKSAGTADGAGVQIHKSNKSAAQVFYLEALGDGRYTIMACCSGRYLTTEDGSFTSGKRVIQSGLSGRAWRIFSEDGALVITPDTETELCLGRRGGSSDPEAVILKKAAGAEDQLWTAQKVDEPSVTFSAGLYTVRVTGQTKYVLDVEKASSGTANVRIHHSNSTAAQKFIFIKNAGGSFTVINASSLMVLDIEGAGTADGTNVQQHTGNGTTAQQWTVKGCPGRYRLVSGCGKVLSLSGVIGEDTNVVISSDKGAQGQRFAFDKATASVAPLDKKIYRITTSLDTAKAVDVPDAGYAEGLLLRIHKSNYTDAQKWQFISTGDGYYVIMNVKNGLCLTAKAHGGSTWGASSGTTVIQYNEIEGAAYKKYQKWKPEPAGDGGYYLRSAVSGLYLDVKGGGSANDTPLQVHKANQSAAQKFYLNRVKTKCYLRWHDYATDSTGKKHWLEGTFWDDPKVSDVDFLAAAIYTEGGSQGLAGMMMIGYTMLSRSSLKDMRYTIYEYGQYEICRDGALTKILKAIKSGSTGGYTNLETARSAARACSQGKAIKLTSSAVITYPGGSKTMTAGQSISKADFAVYNGFMTPAAFARHGFKTAGKHTCTYLGHIYYVTKEVW